METKKKTMVRRKSPHGYQKLLFPAEVIKGLKVPVQLGLNGFRLSRKTVFGNENNSKA